MFKSTNTTKSWRIEMLANGAGFPVRQPDDDFGLCFSGPGLNGKAVSIRRSGPVSLEMRVPAAVAHEMRQDALNTAPFEVDVSGVVRFSSHGPHADTALMRAAALIRSLPDTPLAVFQQQTAGMPTTTEVERLAKRRVGQNIFRASLEEYWKSRCALTGIADRALLRASHTKPWAECASDGERLDVHNGFLLAVHLDAAFDAAMLTFDQDGAVLLSSRLSDPAKTLLLSGASDQVRLTEGHQSYLAHHRERFRLEA